MTESKRNLEGLRRFMIKNNYFGNYVYWHSKFTLDFVLTIKGIILFSSVVEVYEGVKAYLHSSSNCAMCVGGWISRSPVCVATE